MNFVCKPIARNIIDWQGNGDDVGTLAFPPSTRAFNLQTAGHVFGQGKSKAGILLHEDQSLLKLVLDPTRAKREQTFYENLSDDQCRDPVVLNLRALVPRYLGVFKTRIADQEFSFLKLENLTLKFRKPSIMDVKIGFITFDPEASADKIKRTKDKYLTTKTRGFCIPGMKVYNKLSQRYEVYDKSYGKNLTESSITEAFVRFLGGPEDNIDGRIVTRFLDHLNRIKRWFLTQRRFAFYSSSLLFIYESDVTGEPHEVDENDSSNSFIRSLIQEKIFSSKNGEPATPFDYPDYHKYFLKGVEKPYDKMSRRRSKERRNVTMSHRQGSCGSPNDNLDQLTSGGRKGNETPSTEVKMIDFAHVFPAFEIDQNYLSGLNNLIELFQEILNQQAQLKFSTL